MRKLLVTSIAAIGLAATASVSLAQVVVGVSWNNFQEERWKTDEAAIKSVLDPAGAKYISTDAQSSASKQLTDIENLISQGAKVVIILAQDGTAIKPSVDAAISQGVPVIAYDRLINGAPIDNYVSFDNEQVGKLQGQALLDKLKATVKSGKPKIVMINGSPTDNNASLFKKGAHSVLDGQVDIVAEYDTPDWSPDQAQTEMDQAITKVGKSGFDGVYAANDGTAGGAIAAMKAAGIDPKTKPITGQDAELAGIQRIILGEQYMTVYKAISQEASAAAVVAVSLATKQPLPSDLTMTNVNNGTKDVPSVLLVPIAVNKDNIESTVVADKFWTPAQILNTPALQAAGAALGIK
jgi:D-xylose transport system substrate-binding protein